MQPCPVIDAHAPGAGHCAGFMCRPSDMNCQDAWGCHGRTIRPALDTPRDHARRA